MISRFIIATPSQEGTNELRWAMRGCDAIEVFQGRFEDLTSFDCKGTQIRLAVEHYLKPPQHINPSFAQNRHERVHYGGRWGFLHPRPIE